MSVKWSETLAIGIDIIDDQHKEMLNRLHNLLSAMSQGRGKDEINEIINYAVTHFEAEEDLMTKHNYVSYSRQKTEHMLFIKDFSRLKREFETRGASSRLLIQTQQLLCNWLINHIAKEDKKLGAFLKKCA